MSMWKVGNNIEKVSEQSNYCSQENHRKSGLTWCSCQFCGPSGVSASHQGQTWSRNWNNLSPRLSFADCSILGVFVSSLSAGGIVRQVMWVALNWCWMQSAPMKWSIPLQTCPFRVLSCTFHTSCYLVHSHSKAPTLSHCAHQSCYHFPKDSLFLWGRGTL